MGRLAEPDCEPASNVGTLEQTAAILCANSKTYSEVGSESAPILTPRRKQAEERLASLNQRHCRPTASSGRLVLRAPLWELAQRVWLQGAGHRKCLQAYEGRKHQFGGCLSGTHLLRRTRLQKTALLRFSEYQQDQRRPTRTNQTSGRPTEYQRKFLSHPTH